LADQVTKDAGPHAPPRLLIAIPLLVLVGGGALLLHRWSALSAIPDPPSSAKPSDPKADFEYGVPIRRTNTVHTDTGRPIPLGEPDRPRGSAELDPIETRVLESFGLAGRVSREHPASDASNCHGWVFAAGRYWVRPKYVGDILHDNGYGPAADPRPGDIVVYYGDPDRTIWHSGIVREVGSGKVEVESKWNWMGVFRHEVTDSPFGTDYLFFRSPRPGHLLTGLDGSPHPGHAESTGANGH